MAARTRSRFDEPSAGPASDAYTGLLALSLLAMIASCVILYLDFAQYGTQKAPSVNIPAPVAKPLDQKAPAARSTRPANDIVQAPSPIMPAAATEPAPPEPAPVMPVASTPSLLPPANN